MEHEVFAHSNGEMFYAWDVQFADLEQRRESGPCTYHEKGNRPPAATYGSFVEKLRTKIVDMKTFHVDFDQLGQNNKFKFHVRAKTPLELEGG